MPIPSIYRLMLAGCWGVATLVAGSAALALTRCEVMADAQSWVDAQVPYCQGPGGYYCKNCDPCYYDPLRGGECYRSDCSGYVSATWDVAPPGYATGGLCSFGEEIPWDALEPGDALVECEKHAMLFAGWIEPGVTFSVYEETSCGEPAHMATHRRNDDGYWGNMEAQFHALRRPGIQPCDKLPIGYLDSAGCEQISGWAQDPDAPDSPVDVHLYFGGPAGSGSPAVAVHANVHREDLCAAIGSCAHGFSTLSPLSLFDGTTHPIHAYGIGLNGGGNAELGSSPQALACPATIPAGVRRHVVNPDSLAAWKLDSFWDRLPAADSEIAKLEAGEDLPALPKVVQADDGTPEVWVVDGKHRRHVTSPALMDAWRFSWAAIEKLPAAQVAALTKGPAWRARPVMLSESNGTVWIVDEPFEAEPADSGIDAAQHDAGAPEKLDSGTDAPPSKDAGASGWNQASGAASGGEEGCTCATVGAPSRSLPVAWILSALLVVVARRRPAGWKDLDG